MEMGSSQLALRLLGSVGKVDAQKLRTGRLDAQDWDRLGLALGKLNEGTAPHRRDGGPEPAGAARPRAPQVARVRRAGAHRQSTTSS
jgi:hypothetical protein